MQAAVGGTTLAAASLELGGKDPAYVREDADLAHAVENLLDGACFNAGQSCCAIERIYVHERLHDEFAAAYAEQAAGRGLRVIIAGAGGAAHLPGMLSAKTLVPVLGVPVPSRYLAGQD